KPGMNLGAVYAAGRAHIGDNAKKFAVLQQAKGIHPRLAADHGIAAAFERSLHVGHDRGLVFDEQYGQESLSDGWEAHGWVTPAATPSEAVWVDAGKRTMKVAPSPLLLL